MKARWIIPTAMGAAGFLLGWLQSSQAPALAAIGTSNARHRGSIVARANAEIPPERSLQQPDERRATLLAELRAAISHASSAHRRHDLALFFRGVRAEELSSIADAIMALPDGVQRAAMDALMEHWVTVDWDAAAAYLATAPGDRENLRYAFSHAFALHDPEAAIRWAQQLPYAQRTNLQESVAGTLSWKYRDDPARGVRLLLEAGMLNTHRFHGGNLYTAWAEREPRAALACAAGIENIKLRQGLMENALKGWAKSDPAAAAAWCRQLPDADSRNEATAAAAVGMATSEIDQGLALARSLPEGRMRDRTMALMADALFWSRREEAVGILSAIPFESGNKALMQVYSDWFTNDPGGAVRTLCDRLERLPAGEERLAVEKFLEESAPGNFSRVGHDATARTLAERMSDDAAAIGRSLHTAAESWASRQPEQARVWAEGLPEGAAREHALAGIARGWTGGSISEVAAWLDALPASPSRDAATGSFARAVLARDPSGALEWVRTIADPEQRLTTLQSAWSDWKKRSSDAAENWRTTSPDLTAAERQRLLSAQ